jgi:ribosomal protein L44E
MFRDQDFGNNLTELFEGDCPGTQNGRNRRCAVDDSRFKSDPRRLSLKYAGNAPIQIGSNGLPGRRTRPSGYICRWRDQRHPTGAQQIYCDLMIRHPNPDRLQPSRRDQRNFAPFRQDDRQWSREESVDQQPRRRRNLSGNRIDLRQICNVCNQWIIDWPPLGNKDPANRRLVKDTRPKPVDGLSRERDHLAIPDIPCGDHN